MDYSLIANIRYGYGPGLNPVTDATPEALISNMLKEDSVAESFPVSDWKSTIPLHTKTTEASRLLRQVENQSRVIDRCTN